MSYTHTPVRQRATTYQLPDDADDCMKVTYAPGMEGSLNRTELLFASSTDALTVAQLKLVSGADLYDGAVRPVKNGAGNPMGRYVFRLGLATPLQTGVDTLAIQNTAATGWWLHEDLGARVVKTRKRVNVDIYSGHFGSNFAIQKGLAGGAQPGTHNGIMFTAPVDAINNYAAEFELSLPTGQLQGLVAVMVPKKVNTVLSAGDLLAAPLQFNVYAWSDYAATLQVDSGSVPGAPPGIYNVNLGAVNAPNYSEPTGAASLVWNLSRGATGLNMIGASGVNQVLASQSQQAFYFNPLDPLLGVAPPAATVDGKARHVLQYIPHYVSSGGAYVQLFTTLNFLQAIVDVTEVML